jgi:hypothetical protein
MDPRLFFYKNLLFLLILNRVTSSFSPTSPSACSFPTSTGTFDLSSLSTVRIISREESSRGWLYLVNTCANVDSSGTCGDMSFAPAVQVTSGECHGLGHLNQRSVFPFVSDSVNQDSSQFGITISFQGGHSCGSISRNFSITVICADVERVRNANVIESKTIACSYIASVESRVGCPVECPRDPKTGAVCGGRDRGTCNITQRGAMCICATGKIGKSCSDGNEDRVVSTLSSPSHNQNEQNTAGSNISTHLLTRGVFEVDVVACIAFFSLFLLLRHRSGGVNVLDRTKRIRYAVLILVLFFFIEVYRLTSLTSDRALSTPSPRSTLQNALQINNALPGHPINSMKCRNSPSSSWKDIVKLETAPSSELNEGNIAQVAERFNTIYELSEWGEEGKGSGMGSSLKQTNTLRIILEMVIYKFAATSFLDAPCGSAFWWKDLLPRIRENIPCFRYHGVDVAPLAIERAKVLHAGDDLTSFTLGDVSRVPLPVGIDLALCRDALQHLPMAEAVRLLRNLAAAKPKHVLLGSYSSEFLNVKINVGD